MLRRCLKFLEELRAHAEMGYIPAELEKSVSQAFGVDFWKILNEWQPASAVFTHLVKAVLEKHRGFGVELPGTPPTPEEQRKHLEMYSVLRQQMIVKLVDVQEQNLRWALNHVARDGESALERTARLDLFLRYQTTARRDFYRALDEYERRKKRARKRSKAATVRLNRSLGSENRPT